MCRYFFMCTTTRSITFVMLSVTFFLSLTLCVVLCECCSAQILAQWHWTLNFRSNKCHLFLTDLAECCDALKLIQNWLTTMDHNNTRPNICALSSAIVYLFCISFVSDRIFNVSVTSYFFKDHGRQRASTSPLRRPTWPCRSGVNLIKLCFSLSPSLRYQGISGAYS